MPQKKLVAYIAVLIVSLSVLAMVFTILYTGNTKPVRVACIGDSITQYSFYPEMLQDMLGSDYVVGNFGTSGSTVLLDTDMPYIYQHEIIGAKEFLPDIAIIMLGTNDAHTDRFESIDNFVADYKELINIIQELESSPEIFLVKPPPLFENGYGLESANLVDGINPRIEQIANELDFVIIDVYTPLEDCSEYFQDGVHPSIEGATIITEEVYEAISLYTS